MEYLERVLVQDERTYNSVQLSQKLQQERQVGLSAGQANEAAQVQRQTGRICVIVQDNGSIHTSKVVQQTWAQWQAQGLYVFFLPPIVLKCSLLPEGYPIEPEWRHLKRDELAGQMFESEAELAYNVVIDLETRGEKNGHLTRYVDLNAA